MNSAAFNATPKLPGEADYRETLDTAALQRLPADIWRIPDRLNAAIMVLQLLAIFACFHAAAVVVGPWALAALACGFALLMVGVYSIIHEAEHGMLFTNARANLAGGVVMAAFFPVQFHLLRQGHLGHHLRNRSDDEAFDLWFEGEAPLWKWTQWIGILTGLFYLIIVLGNLAVLLLPFVFKRRWFAFDRPSAAFMEALNPKYRRLIQLEALGVCVLHGLIVWWMQIPLAHYLVIYGVFGALWSGLQYLHHYATERHITRGARNVWLWWPLDKLWLNHNWHRVHHEHPTVSWLHLEKLGRAAGDDRVFLPWVYLRMWAGPRKATERVENRFAGKVIR
ncbi:MAG: fatty acid desaturase [Acidobacteria bacterium]|nr:fatty acid desaturase [Acidobacteriota bacterium]MBI3423602.1 fatty acid desaturase [Acidobacteriota bacterium]